MINIISVDDLEHPNEWMNDYLSFEGLDDGDLNIWHFYASR